MRKGKYDYVLEDLSTELVIEFKEACNKLLESYKNTIPIIEYCPLCEATFSKNAYYLCLEDHCSVCPWVMFTSNKGHTPCEAWIQSVDLDSYSIGLYRRRHTPRCAEEQQNKFLKLRIKHLTKWIQLYEDELERRLGWR